MTSAIGGKGTSAGSTCIGDGSLVAGATGVAGLAAGATVGCVVNGAGMGGVTVREGNEKNWGGS